MSENKLVSTSFIYLVFSISTQVLNMLLIPLYTRNLSVEQFGQYSIVSSYQNLLSIFITIGVFSGLRRFYNECDDKNQLKNTALSFSLIWGMLCIAIGAVASPFLGSLAFGGDKLGGRYINYIIANSVLMCLVSIYTSYFAMQFKALKASIFDALKIILLIIASAYFLCVKKNDGVVDILRANLISNMLIAGFLIIGDLKNIRICLIRQQLKQMLSYGMGLLPGQVSAWVLTLIDRYFLKAMTGLSTVGIYSMAYKIGMLIYPVFIAPFSDAFTPFKYKVYKEQGGKDRMIKVFNYYNFIGWLCILGVSLFSSAAISILSTPLYWEGFKVVPLIAFSYYLWGMGQFYGLGLHIANKMLLNSLISTVAAVTNVIANFILIPRYGMYGAAVSTIISYVIANIMFFHAGKKYYDFKISIFEPYKYAGIYIVLYGLYIIFKSNIAKVYLEIPFNIMLCTIYPIACVKTGLVSINEIKDYAVSLGSTIDTRFKAFLKTNNLKG